MSFERHEVFQSDVGAYLLSALTEVEERRFKAHLAECHICSDELERLRPAAQALPRSVWPIEPPPSLRTSLMAVVQEEARLVEGAPARRPAPLAWLRDRVGAAGNALTGMSPGVAWVAAATVLLVGVVSGAAGLYALDGISDDGRQRAPASRTLVASADKTRVPKVSGSLSLPADKMGALLRVQGLDPLEGGGVYQVWVKRRGEVISQSLFTVGADGDGAAAVPDDLQGAEAVLVTRERAGGAKAPTEKSILTVRL